MKMKRAPQNFEDDDDGDVGSIDENLDARGRMGAQIANGGSNRAYHSQAASKPISNGANTMQLDQRGT